MNANEVKNKIQKLIDSGKIKSIDELKDTTLDEFQERFNISPLEFLCYMCQTEIKRECDNQKCKACIAAMN